MTQTTDEIRQVQETARSVRQNVSRVIVGKEAVIDLLMPVLREPAADRRAFFDLYDEHILAIRFSNVRLGPA